MTEDQIVETLGRYQLLKLIAKGGMGEVWLAYDPHCKRQVAIKSVRPELKKHAKVVHRFHKEARINASLTHPGIISVYDFTDDYYVMPYIEGKTLKEKIFHHKGSIGELFPVFTSVCQTIAYTHSKGILHRDIKPENILVGTFGEVILLDWGLAQERDSPDEEGVEDIEGDPTLTNPGKLVGTVAYMAPERASGSPASIQTDLYALGVILYQILTLHFPFDRPALKEFSKQIRRRYIEANEPEEVAPYRGIPPLLSRIVMKMLEPDPINRYRTIEEVMDDLNVHIEGRASWVEADRLSFKRKGDWQFQEHVMISKHLALTGVVEESNWVNVMISKGGFSDHIRLETRVKINPEGAGIGFLLNIPEPPERKSPFDGYCLWLGAEPGALTHLFRNTIEVMAIPDLYLTRNQWHDIVLEKTGQRIQLILDGKERLSYVSYLPLPGTHVGLLLRDTNFEMEENLIKTGSQTLKVSCLAIPDTLLAHNHYEEALTEYRRIGTSFAGYAEGREGLFRAGITLLEQGRTAKDEGLSNQLFAAALEEFSKLHQTPGAPYEYLGKALVYQELGDHLEEIKCLELGLRRYYKHPLATSLRDQISYRMHEAAQSDRRSAYQLALLVLRLLPSVLKREDSKRLFAHLIKHWEPLPFFESTLDPTFQEGKFDALRFCIPLAFWLAAPYTLLEIFEQVSPVDEVASADILFALFELGSYGLAQKLMQAHPSPLLEPLHRCHAESIEAGWMTFKHLGINELNTREFRTLTYLMRYALRYDKEDLVHEMAAYIKPFPLSKEDQIRIDGYRIWAYLKDENWRSAGAIFDQYPLELLNQESTLLHPLYGCYLFLTEGEEIALIHFNGVIETPHPKSYALLGHELANHISEAPGWYQTSFMWERRQLYRLLTLYYALGDHSELEAYYRNLEREEYIFAD